MTTRRQAEGRTTTPAARPPKALRVRFITEIVSELRKVVWPSREEATRLTIMVIAISVAVGLALGLIDLGFAALVRQVFIG